MRVASERQEFEQAAKLRDQLVRRPPGHRDPRRWSSSPPAGHRRGCHGRRRPRGGVPGLLRSARPGDGPARLGRRPGRGSSTRPGLVSPRSCESSTWSTATSRRGCSCPRCRRRQSCWRRGSPDRRGGRGADRRAGPRGKAAAPGGGGAQNAADAFLRHKLRAPPTSEPAPGRSPSLPISSGSAAPLRIECYDISNLGPTDKVGSMVVFEDGLPKRQDYRKFKITGVAGQDDFASMREMLRRRFTRLLERAGTPPGGTPASASRIHPR